MKHSAVIHIVTVHQCCPVALKAVGAAVVKKNRTGLKLAVIVSVINIILIIACVNERIAYIL